MPDEGGPVVSDNSQAARSAPLTLRKPIDESRFFCLLSFYFKLKSDKITFEKSN